MIELRKDYLLNRWVLVNDLRLRRPFDFKPAKKKKAPSHDPKCPFCLGNEEITPPEIVRVGGEKRWKMRVVPNKYPGFLPEEAPGSPKESPFIHKAAYGRHEILIDTPSHDEQFWDFSPQKILEVLDLLKGRIREMRKDPKIKEVDPFKNHGGPSGASLSHSHFQIMGYNHISPLIQEKIAAMRSHREREGHCCYCHIAKLEETGPRFIEKKGSVLAFAPYASSAPYQAAIMPIRHVSNLLDLTDEELLESAILIHQILSKLKTLNAPYNLCFQQVLTEEDFHFQMEITPRLNIWGGFELQTGIVVNTVPPEEAALFYREK